VRENGASTLKQVTLSGAEYPTEAAARRKLGSLVLKINAQTPYAAMEELSLNAVMDRYIEDEMPERPKTKETYLMLMNKHLRPRWGKDRLSTIRPYEVEQWLRALPYSPKTKRHIKSRFHALIEFAMKRGWMEVQRNPLSLVRVKGNERVIEKIVLTPGQMNTVRANLADPYLLMAELCGYLGLRISEVLALKWSDVDLGNGTLRIQRSAVNGNVADVKTEASRAVIPLTPEVRTFINRWIAKAPESDGGWVFPSPVTGKPYHAGILRKRHLAPLASKVGVPRLSWHCFRHSFRSWLDMIGAAPGQQMTLMRHADISTTMNIYGAGLLDSKREILSKLHGHTVGFCGVPIVEQTVSY
jgi:integrase